MPKPRIAIVGGGPAGLSAAYHLTSQPDWKDEYEVTVYQLGWRLGGKGATGRDASRGWRIEEHGIHGFCNFYFNTWRMMKPVYEELQADYPDDFKRLPVRLLEEAFRPSSVSYTVDFIDGCWHDDVGYGPSTSGRPWEETKTEFDWWDVVRGLLRQLLRRGRRGDPESMGAEDLVPPGDLAGPGVELHREIEDLYAGTERAPREASEAVDAYFDDMAERLDEVVVPESLQLHPSGLEWRKNAATHRAVTSLNLFTALLKGLIRERFWRSNFDLDRLDAEDYRAWLKRNGAWDSTLISASVYSVANILFAYPNGDSTRTPWLSAASWLGWMMRSVVGKGEYFHFMAAGTGDTVILPLYLLLRNRDVKFELFHRLKKVESRQVGPDRLAIDKLLFSRQDKVKGGTEYDPLEFLACGSHPGWVWPNKPRWDQLENQSTNEGEVDYEDWKESRGSVNRELVRGAAGDGFEFVVWAIPPSMIPEVGDETMQEVWAPVNRHLTTTATQAAQIWLTEDTKDLGWPRDELEPATARYASASFPNPLNGMVTFDDLIEFEAWGPNAPEGLIYLCSQLQDWPGPQTRVDDAYRVRQSVSSSLRRMGNFLRGARPTNLIDRSDPQAIDFAYLYDRAAGKGEARLDFQYVRANTRPTEAYVQAPPGGVQGRRQAWDDDNVVVAGDWIYTGLNLGAFEGAITGGKLASFALTGSPEIEKIVGYGFFHPDALREAKSVVPKI